MFATVVLTNVVSALVLVRFAIFVLYAAILNWLMPARRVLARVVPTLVTVVALMVVHAAILDRAIHTTMRFGMTLVGGALVLVVTFRVRLATIVNRNMEAVMLVALVVRARIVVVAISILLTFGLLRRWRWRRCHGRVLTMWIVR